MILFALLCVLFCSTGTLASGVPVFQLTDLLPNQESTLPFQFWVYAQDDWTLQFEVEDPSWSETNEVYVGSLTSPQGQWVSDELLLQAKWSDAKQYLIPIDIQSSDGEFLLMIPWEDKYFVSPLNSSSFTAVVDGSLEQLVPGEWMELALPEVYWEEQLIYPQIVSQTYSHESSKVDLNWQHSSFQVAAGEWVDVSLRVDGAVLGDSLQILYGGYLTPNLGWKLNGKPVQPVWNKKENSLDFVLETGTNILQGMFAGGLPSASQASWLKAVYANRESILPGHVSRGWFGEKGLVTVYNTGKQDEPILLPGGGVRSLAGGSQAKFRLPTGLQLLHAMSSGSSYWVDVQPNMEMDITLPEANSNQRSLGYLALMWQPDFNLNLLVTEPDYQLSVANDSVRLSGRKEHLGWYLDQANTTKGYVSLSLDPNILGPFGPFYVRPAQHFRSQPSLIFNLEHPSWGVTTDGTHYTTWVRDNDVELSLTSREGEMPRLGLSLPPWSFVWDWEEASLEYGSLQAKFTQDGDWQLDVALDKGKFFIQKDATIAGGWKIANNDVIKWSTVGRHGDAGLLWETTAYYHQPLTPSWSLELQGRTVLSPAKVEWDAICHLTYQQGGILSKLGFSLQDGFVWKLGLSFPIRGRIIAGSSEQ